MSKLIIEGGHTLEGKITVQGSKNAVLPILAATVLNGTTSIIRNCPELKDVMSTINILKYLGMDVHKEGDVINTDSSSISSYEIPEELMREMRSSVIFLGSIISRFGKATVSMPGGCELGARPIDLHLKAFRQLGVDIEETHGYIICNASKLHAENLHLDFPSVGATENIMLLASSIDGITTISNPAREPEIVDLQNFINAMGGRISGAGTEVIRIEGVHHWHQCEYSVMSDRIVAASYLACGAITGGKIELENIDASLMEAVLSVFRQSGCDVLERNNGMLIIAPKKLKAVSHIRTQPYPGFPTDAQSPLMAVLSVAQGTSIFVENIFESRFKQVAELVRMGADITVDGRMAVIRGVERLDGTKVTAMDLRGGASLVIAALAAEGISEVDNITHIDRGYEQIEKTLRSIGAKILRE